MARKPRSDASPFDRFQADLDQWLSVENLSYKDALERLRAVWPAGERLPSLSSLQRWADRRRQELMLQRIAESSARAQQVQSAFQANPADAYGALLNMIGQAAMEMRIQKGEALDLDTLKDLAEVVKVGLVSRNEDAKLRLREQEIALKERRVVLLERQAADATQTLGNETLTPEQKMAKMREIFGLK